MKIAEGSTLYACAAVSRIERSTRLGGVSVRICPERGTQFGQSVPCMFSTLPSMSDKQKDTEQEYLNKLTYVVDLLNDYREFGVLPDKDLDKYLQMIADGQLQQVYDRIKVPGRS